MIVQKMYFSIISCHHFRNVNNTKHLFSTVELLIFFFKTWTLQKSFVMNWQKLDNFWTKSAKRQILNGTLLANFYFIGLEKKKKRKFSKAGNLQKSFCFFWNFKLQKQYCFLWKRTYEKNTFWNFATIFHPFCINLLKTNGILRLNFDYFNQHLFKTKWIKWKKGNGIWSHNSIYLEGMKKRGWNLVAKFYLFGRIVKKRDGIWSQNSIY